nr:MAG: RNA-dependent RNA polymerase [Porcine picobirnavirus]
MADAYKLPHPQLKSYFQRQVVGNTEVYTTKFADKQGFDNSVDDWNRYLTKHLTDWPSLLEFELHMQSKIGPLSYMVPLRERIPGIIEYYEDVKGEWLPVDPQAIQRVAEKWGASNRLMLASIEQVIDQMKKSTNSGSPYFTKRRLVLERGLVGVVVREGDKWYTITPDGKYRLVATLGWRGQEGGPDVTDVRQRILWMFPMDLNIREAQVYFPLVNYCQRHNYVSSWLGNDAVDRRITALFDSKAPDDYVVGTDFTRFDQHFGRACSDAAASVLARLFAHTSEWDEWITDIYPAKYHIPMVYRWGKAMIGVHGMASGSGGTNGDETVAHSTFQEEAALTAGKRLNPNSMCLGDDGVLSYPGIDVDHVLECYTAHGVVMNTDKQHVSRHDAEYLKRWHHESYRIDNVCVGVYSTMRALGKLKYMERYHDPKVWGSKAVATRALSIIENCCYHPLRNEFLDFCIERDPFRLGLDIPGYIEHLEDEINVATANGILGYQYTDSLSPKPAKSWWVVQALRSRK